MSIALINPGEAGIHKYIIDSSADISNLPSAPVGSYAVLSNKPLYWTYNGEAWLPSYAIDSGGSGAELPEVSADDNGDVLTVVDGAWNKASPSGGVFVIEETIDENYTHTLDKTWQEIKDAAASGKYCFVMNELITPNDDYAVYFYSCSILYGITQYTEEYATTNEIPAYSVNFGSVEYSTETASGYPSYTEDNGGL